ncbi:DoxX family protein [Phytomonospora endophytica]|uniref:Phage-related minor tail protein n=1 Tax=Phytomonospora endophytica TaxID=714109 RepID=A0A841FJ02_9ACTN|nr:DoxX family protein [Phytomonospora endophytica]MBB6034923.1 phage-related minor tail protein [Phytomonospora endophytica]GIG70627.1 membrane protein [Phytomonospora endophytica]
MKIAYWIVAGLLAAFYLFAGAQKLVSSKEKLRPMMGWIDTVPMWAVRLIGVIEVAGAVGLILPPLTGIAPVLALVAAIGFVVLQILAGALHLSRREVKETGLNAGLIVLAGIAAWLATVWL